MTCAPGGCFRRTLIRAAAALAVLIAGAPIDAKPYEDCVRHRLTDGGELEPAPAEFIRQLKALGHDQFYWTTGQIALACHGEPPTRTWHHIRWTIVHLLVTSTWPGESLFALEAALSPAGEERGLASSARREFGKNLQDVNEKEMTWLVVVHRSPSCSAALEPPAMKNRCEDTYRALRERLPEGER